MTHADVSVTRLTPVRLEPLEFELVDFETARRSLEEPPAGVKAVVPVDWPSRRMPQGEADRGLSEATRLWAESLPAQARPRQLLDQFPRVANRIGQSWRDARACRAVLDELIVDRRGGRRGFPRAVADEINALNELRATH